ncbi:DUF2164 family protein [bacterium 1xD8-48]|jgi:uncharacterized protein (DUF2164 family)|nr:DUF2164 family protein [Lachnospiraceae bacterium]MCI9326176.1 DUF2164 family protein [Lachnospiraceae bacterium]NBJ99176.1 DUF2164 family protein [bacterium 1xD8-48]
MYSFADEQKKQMLGEITQFFKEEHEIELGLIGSERIFDFFQETLGRRIYNKALDDAKKFYENYAGNMEADFYSLYKNE